MGRTHYFNQVFDYVECMACRSLYCDPMPDARTLAHMYGPAYGQQSETGAEVTDPKEPERVLLWLRSNPAGIFLDYGCGDGRLLAGAHALGWQAVGFELDAQVARRTAERTGVSVYSDLALLRREVRADVMNLGDVIEHLTDLEHQMPELLNVLKPGGILLAQGPLEANTNLFTLALRAQRFLRRSPPSQLPPYHVLLATAQGQRQFFRRFGLVEMEYDVREVDWPAPSRLNPRELKHPRAVVMFALRKASQMISRLSPGDLGNRYFYVGRLATASAAPLPAETAVG
jgi:SAM-dependent methyltransferase